MKKTLEPFWWSLFSAGGTFAALFLPALIFFTGLAVPLGWIEEPAYDRLLSLIQPTIVRIMIFGVISLSLFHWAHRFRFTLYDGLQLKHLNQLIAVLCYGGALIGTIAAAATLTRF
jgi:fumarate reductase subunit D